MNCPLCIETMLEPHHRAGMEIDVCPTCKGIWLDRGELEGLMGDAAGSTRKAERNRPSRPDSGRDDEGDSSSSKGKSKSKKKRKKSWGERLGDALEDVLDL